MKCSTIYVLVGFCSVYCVAAAHAAEFEVVLPAFAVTPSNVGTFHQPLAVYDGIVFVADVEPPPGPPDGMNLKTIVHRGQRDANGNWNWTSVVLEPRTIDDPWHAIPSLAVDRLGRVHVAFNMHNMPWQYARTSSPGDIATFEFRGEKLSDADIAATKYDNHPPSGALGAAAIPGTGVTYASFFNDRRGDLWVTYRQALKPKLDWSDRQYGCGVARYDADRDKWSSIGGELKLRPEEADLPQGGLGDRVVNAFCASAHWWALDIRLAFGLDDSVHAVWTWSDYLHGNEANARTDINVYARSNDGGRSFVKADGAPLTLPIDVADSGRYVATDDNYPARGLTLDHDGEPVIAVQPYGKAYKIVRFDHSAGQWTALEASPDGASTLARISHSAGCIGAANQR